MSVHFFQTKSWRSHTNKKDSENTSKSLGSAHPQARAHSQAETHPHARRIVRPTIVLYLRCRN